MIKKITTIGFVLLFSANLFSGVNLKNGNFYISYTDIHIGSNYIYEFISRTYNSKSTYSGVFGYGWGVDFETYISIYPDGSIVVSEHGGGGNTRFTTSFYDESLLEDMIDQLMDVAVEEGDVKNNPTAMVNFRSRLRNNSELRAAYWDKYVEEGYLEYSADIYPVGTEWESFERGNAKITKSENGFVRSGFSDDEIEVFNNSGKLIKEDHGAGSFIDFYYSESGVLEKMVNSDGKEILFTFDNQNRIIEIRVDDRVTTYEYDEDGNLIKNIDDQGAEFLYTYDDKHNMTSVIYGEDDRMLIEYHSKTLYVKKITDRNGEETSYEYIKYYKEDGTEDKDHYATEVTKLNYYGNPVTNFYEYEIETDGQGNRYTRRIFTRINGIETNTIYSSCGSPTKISRGERTTTFEYNNRCLMTKKESASEKIEIRYHDTLEKIVWVSNNGKVNTFDYNKTGDLIYAAEEGGSSVELRYNEAGKVYEMKADTSVLSFEYNEIGKPVKIKMESIGTVNVTYDEYGDIQRVNSEEGTSIALKITQAFQKLLALVRPAGVSLNM